MVLLANVIKLVRQKQQRVLVAKNTQTFLKPFSKLVPALT
jgi:hypothetical protein